MHRKILYLVFVCLYMHGVTLQDREEKDFISSFVSNYGFSACARDTREYHPYILAQTRESFLALEKALCNNEFNLCGRIVIAGYQQDAISNYYSCCKDAIIDDEASVKTKVGWRFAPGNLFGFVTGFVLSDVNSLADQHSIFEHVVPERVGLFDHRATVFHQHAFGQSYELLIAARKKILRHIAQSNTKGALSAVRDMWKLLYVRECKDGSASIIATQDILFSLHYGKYLIDSPLPLLKFFIGPDITYPIEVLPCQKQQATQGAQEFLKQLTSQLKPIDTRSTAYIFCSFVDGVGKSTLLGNIKNWCAHKDAYASYTRVDNTSSQSAQIFNFAPNVYIVDLPAQISHFTYKPDGAVYVDSQTVPSLSPDHYRLMVDYISHNAATLIDSFKKMLLQQSYDTSEPAHLYAYNVRILGKKEVEWIPFTYDGINGLFNSLDTTRIRILTPFDQVHSFGLKVAEPEQMLFTHGVKFPWKFNAFANDLVAKMKDNGIENVVFVDFASMYPRTSRENIRVNFLLQQLCGLFDQGFLIEKSLYRNSTSAQELYGLLVREREQVCKGMLLETGMRFALVRVLEECQHNGIEKLSTKQLQEKLKAQFWHVYDVYQHELLLSVNQRIAEEIKQLRVEYAYDKEFEALTRFDFKALATFSDVVEQLFTQQISDEYFNQLWSGFDTVFESSYNQNVISAPVAIEQQHRHLPILQGQDGQKYAVLFSFNGECRDRVALKVFFKRVRAQWYAALSNLLNAQDCGDLFTIDTLEVAVPPLLIKKDSNGVYHCLQKVLDCVDVVGEKPPSLFFTEALHENNRMQRWAVIGETPHCLDWQGIKTATDLYAFGYNPHVPHKTMLTHLIMAYKKVHEEKGQNNYFMAAADLQYQLNNVNCWQEVATQAARFNGIEKRLQLPSKKALQLFVRSLATLEMLVKDLDADVMVRRGYEEDFAAALELIERITLPSYFGIQLNKPLFEDYATVEAVIDWDLLSEM